MARQREMDDDDVDLDDDEHEGAPVANRRIAIVAGAAVAVVAAHRGRAAHRAPAAGGQRAHVHADHRDSWSCPPPRRVVPSSFACPAGGRGPAPWTSAVKPSSSSGAGSGQLVAALLTVVAAAQRRRRRRTCRRRVWVSSPTNQSKIGFDQDVPLCAFVDTGALAGNLDQSSDGHRCAPSSSPTWPTLKQKKAGTGYAVDVKGSSPGARPPWWPSASWRRSTGPATGPARGEGARRGRRRPSGARVTPGGRDARAQRGRPHRRRRGRACRSTPTASCGPAASPCRCACASPTPCPTPPSARSSGSSATTRVSRSVDLQVRRRRRRAHRRAAAEGALYTCTHRLPRARRGGHRDPVGHRGRRRRHPVHRQGRRAARRATPTSASGPASPSWPARPATGPPPTWPATSPPTPCSASPSCRAAWPTTCAPAS